MRKAFKVMVGDVPAILTHSGRVIVATNELELANGIGEPFDLDEEQMSVTEWFAIQGHALRPTGQRTPPLEVGGTPRRILRDQYNAITEFCRRTYPREGCGMIAGRDVPGEPLISRNVNIYNASPTPRRAYQFAEDAQLGLYREMDKMGWDPLVIWHSHTFGDEHPSDTDLELATEPNAVYLILSYAHPALPPVPGWWQIRDGVARPVQVELVD